MTADANLGWATIDPAAQSPDRRRASCGRPITAIALALAVSAAPMLAACTSGQAPSSAASASQTCSAVSATLSDGPDPAADPVGYAEAQIAPLRQIHAPDPALRIAIGHLASAYAKVFASDGKNAAATRAVAVASKNLNSICPGAAA